MSVDPRLRPIFRVQVDITPQWVTPPDGTTAERIARAEAENRFAALAHELEKWLESTLESMSEEDLATASYTLRKALMEQRAK